ncbi:MAG TPA: NF038122 family metalloprotease [Fimbriimonadaceae bacterium]|nr:NF038122 family metalloprotease [Fimbriimonadaceae bacterium]
MTLAAVAGAMAIAGTAHAGFVINPIWDSSITSRSDAAQTEATIQMAINNFESIYNNNMTISITFHANTSLGGGGQSSTPYYIINTSDYLNDLHATASGDAIDTAAWSELQSNPTNGNSNKQMYLTFANAKAIGYFDSGTGSYGDVYIDPSNSFFNHTSPQSGKTDLYAVVSHEIDEVLGTSSGVGNGGAWFTATDFFRFGSTNHVRSFTTDTTQHAYFSVDGVNHIDEYNQIGRTGGDWGDWIDHGSANKQVQDWVVYSNLLINYGVGETSLLDAVGYNVSPAPEPASIALLGLGAVALLRRRALKK